MTGESPARRAVHGARASRQTMTIDAALSAFEVEMEHRLGKAESDAAWWDFVLELYDALRCQLAPELRERFEVVVDGWLSKRGYSSLSVQRAMRS